MGKKLAVISLFCFGMGLLIGLAHEDGVKEGWEQCEQSYEDTDMSLYDGPVES
jgi:hypothetical protein